MFEYIKGKAVYIGHDYVIFDVGGFGLKIYVTNNSYIIENVYKLFIYYFISENARQLYGFSYITERDVFTKLIGIKNIGIKTAYNILKNDNYELIIGAALSQNYDFLLSINKINETNVDTLIKNLKSIEYRDNFEMNKDYYASLKALDYPDSKIYLSYKRIDKSLPINLMIKEGIKIMESGGLNE